MSQHHRLTIALLLLACLLFGPGPSARAQDVVVDVDSADLIATVQVIPAVPAIDQEVTVDIVVENVGGVAALAPITVEIYYYTATPPTTAEAGFPVANYNLNLGAGGSFTAMDTHTFSSLGCNNYVGVWVDRVNDVAEGDNNNNFAFVQVCVGGVPQCASTDAFEADNTCATAKWLQEAAPQARDLCNPTDPNAPDTDWVKFTGFAGVQYNVSAVKPPASSADAQVTVFPSCSAGALAGPTATQASFTVANSGVYYAKVERQGGATVDNTAYTLAVASNTGVTDAYEPDDSCATARDILTNDTRQSHRFNKANDEDWVRFTAHAGESFVIATDQAGPNVSPVLTLSDSCAGGGNQPLAEVQAAAGDAIVSGSTTLDRIFYVRARNSNGTVFGTDKTYAIRVKSTTCSADAFEDDDVPAQAKALALGAPQPGRTSCPPGDEDWLKFSLTANKIYVLETTALGTGADTVLALFAPNGALIGENDDFGYTKASRLVLRPTASGAYTARVRHADAGASGPTTNYTVALREGFCLPDALEGATGNNGPGDARPAQFGATASANFCADPLNPNFGDQDWITFNSVINGKYQVKTSGLGPNSDTVLELYTASGTLLAASDDSEPGRSTLLNYTAPAAGPLYARVTQFNSNINGSQTDYQVQVSANEPPPPTPVATPPPIPPAPTPPPNPARARTLFVTNRARLVTLYGATAADNVLAELYTLADNPAVQGAVIQVDAIPAASAAYTEWLADPGSVPKANAVAAAVRNQLMTFLVGSSVAKYVVIVGDDRVVPFRRVLDLVPPKGASGGSIEQNYAGSVSANSTVRAALAQNMILTDDYYVDKEPGTWKDKNKNLHELYLPDFAVARLIETPAEIIGMIDQFQAGHVIDAKQKVLITGYDFVQDSADTIETLYRNDLAQTTKIIDPVWLKSTLVAALLTTTFDITSLNGHSKHIALGTADNQEITAAEIVAAPANLAGKLVYSVGCHAGLNDPAVLDLPQAYMQRKATYIGNTGFGWGGGGVVYSEALMRNLTRELLRDLKAEIGPSLSAAKLKYYSRAQVFGPYDAKILMQTTLYGLPMTEVVSAGNLQDGDEFPSAGDIVTPPTAFGPIASGRFGYDLNANASFGSSTGPQGTVYDLDKNVAFAAGEPILPTYFGSASAPAAGTLRGVLFISGTFTTTAGVNPVIALADNEYVTDKSEPSFASTGGWYPSIPYVIRNGDDISASVDSLVLTLGQFDAGPTGIVAASDTGQQRVYEQMAFSTFYSFSADETPPSVDFVDGVLETAGATARIKVEARDASGVTKVLVSYTAGQSQWQSKELTYEAGAQVWAGVIPATAQSRYFVQAVDGAGNVFAADNKGRYYPLLPPLPLVQGASFPSGKVYLPVVTKR